MYANVSALDRPCEVTIVSGTVEGLVPRSGTVMVQEVCEVQLVGALALPKYATTSPVLL